jgi:hypothetical protein
MAQIVGAAEIFEGRDTFTLHLVEHKVGGGPECPGEGDAVTQHGMQAVKGHDDQSCYAVNHLVGTQLLCVSLSYNAN